jgi:hypothetical protein
MHYNFYIFIGSRSSNYSDLAFVLSCKMVFSFALHGGAIGINRPMLHVALGMVGIVKKCSMNISFRY